jgi:hypothetical protein
MPQFVTFANTLTNTGKYRNALMQAYNRVRNYSALFDKAFDYAVISSGSEKS